MTHIKWEVQPEKSWVPLSRGQVNVVSTCSSANVESTDNITFAQRWPVNVGSTESKIMLIDMYTPRFLWLNFFQVEVCGPDFQSVGLANWYLPLKEGACELKISKSGGLWTENFQIWGLWAKIWAKIEAIETKISKFSLKGFLWTDSFAWNGTLANYRRGVKKGSSGLHIPIPPF